VAVESDEVMALAFSPDGTLLAGGGMGKPVRLWATSDHRLVRTLGGPRGMVRGVAFSPDSKTVAACSDDGAVYLWEASGGAAKRALLGHEGFLTCVAFSPDGKTLASGSFLATDAARYAGEVRLWDPAKGVLKRAVPRADGRVQGVAFSPDGKTLAVALGRMGASGVDLCDPVTGKVVMSLPFDGAPLSVAFSPDGKLVAAGGGHGVAVAGGSRAVGEAKIWRVADGKLLQSLKGEGNGYYRSVAFTPDGKRLATGSEGPVRAFVENGSRVQQVMCETRLWEVATGGLAWRAEGGGGEAKAVAVSPDGDVLAVCDDRNTRLLDLKSGTERRVLAGVTMKPVGK
jgi:WD40 repeat protein